MRILLDTNILISAMLRSIGPPGLLVERWLEDEFLLITSAYQVEELRRVAQYSRLKSRINTVRLNKVLTNLDVKAEIIDDLPAIELSPDPKDNPILATAIAGKADLIVSGDKSDMVALGNVEGIPILNPRDALSRIIEGRSV